MTEFGAIVAHREFSCVLCGQRFTLFCGDLIIPEYLVCGDCKAELRDREEEEVRAYVTEHLVEDAPRHDAAFVEEIVRAILSLRQ